TVEPEGYDDVVRSLASGVIVPVENPGPARCDALQTLKMVQLSYDTLRAQSARAMAVTETEAARAVGFAFRVLKLVVEPAGAVALAAALSGRADIAGKTVVVILSGGNVEPAVFAECLAVG
ncbi:MAG: pyridoxal-phosphate dependent enzyme, partial [Sandarakinorhabdus sp.]|nr:pyridoxal-phosphate dependent enzyme [Sandarakinorhabdus sp.]